MKKNSEVSLTVLRAIKVLDYLYKSAGPQSISEISESLNISTTIVHRLLATLKSKGIVFQDPRTRMYSLGPTLLDYANKIIKDMPVVPAIEKYLMKIRELTKETVGFYVQSGDSKICVISYESPQEIRHSIMVQRPHPLHLGASGRAILAYLPEEIQEKIYNSLDSEERLLTIKKIKETKQRGFAINEEELKENVASLAIPIFGKSDRVIGSLAISGPLYRWNKSTMQIYIQKINKICNELMESISY